MKTTRSLFTLVAISVLCSGSPALKADTNAFASLLTLARAATDEYPKLREGFLQTNTIQFDIEEATRFGWEAGLTSWILSDTNWSPMPLAPGNGASQTLTDSGVTNAMGFYRIRQW